MPSEAAAHACDGAVPPAALIVPHWPAPPGVGAVMSTRQGGVSAAPFDTLNLGGAAGDTREAVVENRRRFVGALGARPVWMRQVHGTNVLRLHADTPEHPAEAADAAWTTERGVACIVGAADCLPVLFALGDGSAVAAAHAGWRGLAAGVLEAAVGALAQGTGAVPGELQAWLGPCIGPGAFEVGAEVLAAFGVEPAASDTEFFSYAPRPGGAARWRADLQGLAQARLRRAGLRQISIERSCTHGDATRFFSFRRDGVTGRMAAAIWRCRT